MRRLSGLHVVVVGDLMLDRFLRGTVTRISPEAPVPVVHLDCEDASPGGAGNVARNLHAMGGRVGLVGAVGRDAGAQQLRKCMEEAGLETGRLVEVPGRGTTIKTRVIAHHQQVVRIDREVTSRLPDSAVSVLIEGVLSLLPGAAALLISDYDKGVISPALLRQVLPAAASEGLVVTVDPKPSNYEHYRPVTAITPNAQEARAMWKGTGKEEADLLEAGGVIREHLGCAGVLVTQGEEGMTLFQAGRNPLKIRAVAREVFDVTGAGDTVIAALTLALAAGGSLEEAAVLANLAAGLVVGKLGTATVTTDELLRAASSSDMPPFKGEALRGP